MATVLITVIGIIAGVVLVTVFLGDLVLRGIGMRKKRKTEDDRESEISQ